MPIMTVSATVFYRIAPYMPIPDGVPTNFAFKQHAVHQFWSGSSSIMPITMIYVRTQ